MYFLVQFPDSSLGIYNQKHISKEINGKCIVKHKGSKYEASVINKNCSSAELEKQKDALAIDIIDKDAERIAEEIKSSNDNASNTADRNNNCDEFSSLVNSLFTEDVGEIGNSEIPSFIGANDISGDISNVVDQSTLEFLEKTMPNELLDSTIVFSFECQPGDVIDLNETNKVTISPYGAGSISDLFEQDSQYGIFQNDHEEENISEYLPDSDSDRSESNAEEINCEGSEDTHSSSVRNSSKLEQTQSSINSSSMMEQFEACREENLTVQKSREKKGDTHSSSVRDSSKLEQTQSSINSSSMMEQFEACREENLTVQKSRGKKGDKKANFCIYCNTKQQKIARHLELKHKEEDDVKKFILLPRGCVERRKIIEVIRKRGNFKFNTNKDFNDGELIVSRRPNSKHHREAHYYKACGNCKAFFSKNTLRAHFKKCSKIDSRKTRSVMIMSKRVMSRIHHKADEIVRKQLFPSLREDDVTKVIRYDELIIIFANKMVQKYRNERHFEMIRQRMRLLGRFLLSLRKFNSDVSDLSSVFDPQHIDDTIKAINVEAKLKEDNTYETPTVAFSLGTLLKQVGNILINECIKKHDEEKKINTENFLKLLIQETAFSVNKTVSESQFQYQRRKSVVLPSTEDIKKLHSFLIIQRRNAFEKLHSAFSYSEWLKLAESTLSSVQLFNRRRAGEVERILIEDFNTYQSIDESTDKDLFLSLSKESRDLAKKYVRFSIRGKLNRNVPVLLDKNLLSCIQLMMKHRRDAGVSVKNPYVFGVPSNQKLGFKYLRACALLRKHAEDCGAQNPERLRGTSLRKHIATICVSLNLNENEVSDLANFMGHHEKIHKNFYRQPQISREILKMSKLLEKAQGYDEASNDTSSESENEVDDQGQSEIQPPSRRSSPETQLNIEPVMNTSNSSRKRSTSPYGPVKRKKWSSEEKNIILTEYSSNIKKGKLPSLAQIQSTIKMHRCLTGRRSAQVKTWIHNQVKKNRQS